MALFWEDGNSIRQVIAVDVNTGEIHPLTRHSADVLRFSVDAHGTLIYSAALARSQRDLKPDYNQGRVVQASDAIELLTGARGAWDWMNHERFIVTTSHPAPRRLHFAQSDAVSRYLPLTALATFSQDGRLAIAPHSVTCTDLPVGWERYALDHFRSMLEACASNPASFYARQFEKLFVIDIASATTRTLWQAPNHPYGLQRVAWSPNSRSVLLGPTFLPIQTADAAGLAAETVVEVSIESGEYRRLPIEASKARTVVALSWTSNDHAEILLRNGESLRVSKHHSQWRLDHDVASEPESAERREPKYRVELRQDLNTPPALYGIELASGREAKLLDLNPKLRQLSLGRVEWIDARSADGKQWEGRLYYPVHYRPGQRYPLVFQTYVHAPRSEFSLYGHSQPALGPGRSAYLAQVLANRDIFVLHGPSRAESIDEVRRQIAALETRINTLSAKGLVDRERVGIMGYSASGWLTTYALAHSNFPYAAAITDDNKDGGYLQAALSSWDFASGAEMIGAAPFGAGLKLWIQHSPAMNAERIRTPLLLTRSSPAMELSGWEMFSRLRYLKKPVEYYFVPQISHGSHGLQNPRQVRALQERALDWWCFWLKDEEDSDPAKVSQYQGWRQLRKLHEADARRRDLIPPPS